MFVNVFSTIKIISCFCIFWYLAYIWVRIWAQLIIDNLGRLHVDSHWALLSTVNLETKSDSEIRFFMLHRLCSPAKRWQKHRVFHSSLTELLCLYLSVLWPVKPSRCAYVYFFAAVRCRQEKWNCFHVCSCDAPCSAKERSHHATAITCRLHGWTACGLWGSLVCACTIFRYVESAEKYLPMKSWYCNSTCLMSDIVMASLPKSTIPPS